MGKPMVMTRTGGAAEQVKDGATGFLFAPGDVTALAFRLDSLAVLERSEHMGAAAAQDVARRFPLSKMIANYSALFEAQAASTGVSEFRPS